MTMSKIKYFLMPIVLLFSANSLAGTVENDLTIRKISAYANGNSMLYIKVDREIGPDSCKSNTIKVLLGSEDDSQTDIASKNSIRTLAITALSTGLKVNVALADECLYGNPSIELLGISK